MGRCEAAGGRLFIPRSPASFHGALHRFAGRGGVGRVLSHLRKGSHLSLRSCTLLGHHDGPVRMNEAHRGVLASPLYFSVFHRCSFIYQGKLVSKKALATKKLPRRELDS